MTYESHEEKRPFLCREMDRNKPDERGERRSPIVAVGPEVV